MATLVRYGTSNDTILYIDESGDPGLDRGGGSSSHFVVDMVQLPNRAPLNSLAHVQRSRSIDTADHLPFAHLDTISEDAYPVGVVIERQGQVRRPTRVEWEWYEAGLRVIPVVVREHLHSNSHGDHEPIEADISVKTQKSLIKVGVKYPAGELGAEPDDHQSDLRHAQEIMYDAWEETNPAKRIALAHEALNLSADCAGAYVLLAQEEADTLKRALDMYKQGREAGARALGAKYFRENARHFEEHRQSKDTQLSHDRITSGVDRIQSEPMEKAADLCGIFRLEQNHLLLANERQVYGVNSCHASIQATI